jgi:hypothetical protein
MSRSDPTKDSTNRGNNFAGFAERWCSSLAAPALSQDFEQRTTVEANKDVETNNRNEIVGSLLWIVNCSGDENEKQ